MRSKYILSSVLIMRMVVFGAFAADDTVLADEAVNITCPSDYPNIDSNATSENDCWRECTTDDVANSMSVVGKNYYGDGADTCAATECMAGWHVKPGLDIGATIGEEAGTNSARIDNTGSFSEINYDGKGSKGQEYYGISDKNSFAVDYAGKGILTGHGRCSTQLGNGGNSPTIINELDDETGMAGAKYCYCQVDGFTPTGGDKVIVTSAPWVFNSIGGFGSADGCAAGCALNCANSLRAAGVDVLAFRAAVMNSLPELPATCEEIKYTLNPGEYLPAGGEEPVDCPNGSYCPGVGDVKYDEEKDQGLVLCPTDYPNSDTGAKTESDCYKPCTTDDVAGAMSVVGKNYYGAGADTCLATECMAGWHIKPGVDIGETIGEDKGANSATINNTGSFSEKNYDGNGAKGQEYYGISGPMSFAVNYAGKGMLTGHGRCSKQAGINNNWTWTDPTIVNNLTDETGQEGATYCYCQVDGFTPTGGDKVMVTSAPWVFSFDLDSADSCASGCANECAYSLLSGDVRSLAFRTAVMDATGNIGPGTCEEITYTLNPGEYLPAGGEEPVDCPSGYYCPGVGDVRWDEKNDQGLVLCPTDFPNSDTGAKTESDCYKPCTTDDVAGAMSVVGKNYYGAGADTCAATECVAGWELKPGLNLAETIGEEKGANSAFIKNDGSFSEVNLDDKGRKGQEYYGISGPMSFAVDYAGKGMLTGHGRCSTQAGVREFDYSTNTAGEITIVNTLTDETDQEGAQYCYCQVDGFTPVDGTKAIVTSAPWVFYSDHGSADNCADYCAGYCANDLSNVGVSNLAFRAAVMDATGNIGPGTCEEITYTLNPGEYLQAGGEEPVDCPSGYYCPGGAFVRYDEEKDQGLVACPDGYDNSDIGATSENQCYKQCTTDDVANSMSVTGKNYYGDGADTCLATECMAGWFVKPGLDIGATIGEDAGSNSAYINNNGSFGEGIFYNQGSKGQEYYGISDKNSFAVDYAGKGILTGHGRCSTRAGTNNNVTWTDPTIVNNLTDETGMTGAQYCYCQVDGFTPTGGTKAIVTSAPWVFNDDRGSADYCAGSCAHYCAHDLRTDSVNSLAFRAAVMNNLPALPGICEEIKYTLNPGEYLPAGGEEPVDCPSGSYCPGAGDVKYDEEKDQGLAACPDGYDNSDSGAKSENDCYKQCTTDDVAGSMTVSGQNYYGSNGKSCIATSCVAGWGLKNFVNQIGTEYGLNSAYISTNSQSYGRFYEENFEGDGPKGQDYYGISELGTFAVDYGEKGMITGRGRCSTQEGVYNFDWNTYTLTDVTVLDSLADETGQSGANYCYCQVDGYTPVGELTQVLSDMPWVFEGEFWSEFACNDHCAQSCAGDLRADDTYFQEFRSAVFSEPNVCVPESYRMNAGIYLPAGASDAVICPSGSYCPGADNVKLNEDKDQGLVACPVDYPNSDTGAKSENDCYKQCTTDDVANSMTVTGKNYYGDRYDTCAATQCLADWKLQDLYGIVGDTEGLNSAYISTNSSSYGEFVEYNEPRGQDYYAISEPGTFGIDYGDMGVITGRTRCSTKPGVGGANPTRFKELEDESSVDGARYCYCRVESYTPVGGLTQVLSDMPWVFKEESWSESGCNEYCAQSCAGGLKPAYEEVLAFRSAVFGYASCDEEVYRVNPGDYLPEGADAPSDCPPGSYCPGAEDISSRPSKAQGANECPSEYPYSDSGAKSENSCYRDCTSDDVVNSMTVAGRNYYGDGVDTCEPTDCVAGWHLKLGLNLEDLIGSTYEGSNSEYMAGENSAYIDNNGSFVEYNTADNGAAKGQEYYGITSNNSFAVGYGDSGMIRGHSICSTQSDDIVDDLTDESDNTDATNCYCRIEEYISADGVKQNVAASWVKWGDISWYPGACESNCVQNCASNMREHMTLDFRGKMFEASMEIPMCLANKININWNLGYGDNNSSTTTCSYNEVIVLPQEPVRSGYIFTGWKVLKSNQ